jgi:hypothetical protein
MKFNINKRLKFKRIRSNQGNVFINRLTFYLKKGSIKLHLITGDDSEVYHTHPWDFTSFILFGGYKEYYRGVESERFRGRATVNGKWNQLRIFRTFSINKKLHHQQHRVELFKLFGITIPALTIGIYSEKLQLCSFCKEAGRCLANDKSSK